MKKAAFCFWADICLFFAFISLATTGFILEWGFSRGGGKGWQGGRDLLDGISGGASRSFLGISKHGWAEVHFAVALVLVALVILHLALHWDRIVCSFRNLFSSKPGK